MGEFFECYKGCTDCCEDPSLAVPVTVEDIARISGKQGITITEFFDKSLVARLIPNSNEAVACLRMPCPYIGEIEKGVNGCAIHDYKPIACVFAPENLHLLKPEEREKQEQKFSCLKPVTKKRYKELNKVAKKLKSENGITCAILYSPGIRVPMGFLEKSRIFREILSEKATSERITLASIAAVDSAYRGELRQDFKEFEKDMAQYRTIDGVLSGER